MSFLGAKLLSEPDFPYNRKPRPEEAAAKPEEPIMMPPPPDYPPSPPNPPPPPPLDTENVSKFTCQTCGKTFNTREELAMHVETEHQSPKKESLANA